MTNPVMLFTADQHVPNDWFAITVAPSSSPRVCAATFAQDCMVIVARDGVTIYALGEGEAIETEGFEANQIRWLKRVNIFGPGKRLMYSSDDAKDMCSPFRVKATDLDSMAA